MNGEGKERRGVGLEREGGVGFVYLFLIIIIWKRNSLELCLISCMSRRSFMRWYALLAGQRYVKTFEARRCGRKTSRIDFCLIDEEIVNIIMDN